MKARRNTDRLYTIELVYSHGRNSYLSVKGRSQWRTERIAIAHALDLFGVESKDGIKRDLIGVIVHVDDWTPVLRLEVQP